MGRSYPGDDSPYSLDIDHEVVLGLKRRWRELYEVEELLGHASVAKTLDTYSHMLPGMGGEAADVMEAVLG